MLSSDPFLKWPGGKRWLVQRHQSLFPKFTGKYIEPFLGSGAVFFHINPSRAILSDKNHQLIETYSAVRDFPRAIIGRLAELQCIHSPEIYYRVRKTVPTGKIDRAARFIYLNRTCWNGLYRVNRRGEFNVPIGTKSQVEFPVGKLEEAAHALRNVELVACDFELSLARAERGDFVYVDPPYTVSHNNNGFVKYNDVLFSWDDQRRLARAVLRASDAGAFVFVSNASHSAVADLYSSLPVRKVLSRASILSGKPEKRRGTEEAAFFNYCPETSCLY